MAKVNHYLVAINVMTLGGAFACLSVFTSGDPSGLQYIMLYLGVMVAVVCVVATLATVVWFRTCPPVAWSTGAIALFLGLVGRLDLHFGYTAQLDFYGTVLSGTVAFSAVVNAIWAGRQVNWLDGL